MGSNDFEMNYMLDELNVNLYNREDLNKLVIAEKEDLNKFSCKAILYYILHGELKHDLVCDYHIIGVGNVGLYDVTTRTIYQLESSSFMNNKHLTENDILNHSEVEVIIIFLEDLPDNIFQRYLKLKEYVFSD